MTATVSSRGYHSAESQFPANNEKKDIVRYILLVLTVVTGSFALQSCWDRVGRIVAVGDVHGDYNQFVKILEGAGLIDDQLNWTGGKTHLVQIGDVLDRGPDSRAVMNLLISLEQQASISGGYVHCLLGA